MVYMVSGLCDIGRSFVGKKLMIMKVLRKIRVKNKADFWACLYRGSSNPVFISIK